MPLPNLDFKIETGDSLLAPDPQEMPDLFRGLLQASADVLAMVKRQYFISHGDDKESYRKTIEKEESRLRAELHEEHGDNVVDWRIQFAEAFTTGKRGFDIVLANPPYVRMELIKELKPLLRELYPEVYNGNADLFCYFYARAVQLLRTGGTIVFISSNKWLRANYGLDLRTHLQKTCQVQGIIDFGDLPVFSSATAYPMIFIGRKSRGTGSLEIHRSEDSGCSVPEPSGACRTARPRPSSRSNSRWNMAVVCCSTSRVTKVR